MSVRGLVVGTAGHVDHGKTALVRALTGTDTDRWREEKERGLTIDIGFARLSLGADLEVGVVDVPGHEDFVRNMLAGSTGVDLLLLAVAADEGPMPQTVEHLAIARVLGVHRGVLALTKADRVEPEWMALAREAAEEELLRVMGPVDWPVVEVSATAGEGLDALRDALREVAAAIPGRASEDRFRMPVDRAFTVHGTGTVVTGTVWSGRVRTGETLRVLPGDLSARVRTLEVHGERRQEVSAGRRCALALVGLAPGDVPRGSTLVDGAPWPVAGRIGTRLRLLPHMAREVSHGQRLRLYLGTREVMARVELPDRGVLLPGQSSPALLRLESPLAARARDRVVVRFYSPVTTLGGARVAELDPPRRWRDRVDAWSRVLDGTPPAAFAAAVELAAGRGLADDALPVATGLGRPALEGVRREPGERIVRMEGTWYSDAALADARAATEEALRRLHEERRRASAVSLEALRSSITGRFAPALADRAVDELESAGRLVVEGGRVRRPGHRPVLTDEERRARADLLTLLDEAGLEPPALTELPRRLRLERSAVHDLLDLLEEEGEVVALNAELYVTGERAAELPERARRLLRERSRATPAEFREEFGTSRKYLIPILEYLDRSGVTRRTGEGRELAAPGG